MAPVVIENTANKVPSHLPKINPAKSTTGLPNPNIKIQTIVKTIKTMDSKNIFDSLILIKYSLLD